MQKRVNREFVLRCWEQRDLHSHVVSLGLQIKKKMKRNRRKISVVHVTHKQTDGPYLGQKRYTTTKRI